MLGYRKPAFWAAVVALIAVIAVGVGLLTNPREEQENPSASQSQLDIDTMLASVENMYQGYNVGNGWRPEYGGQGLAAFLVQLPPEGEGDPPAILVGVDKETGKYGNMVKKGKNGSRRRPILVKRHLFKTCFRVLSLRTGR